MLTIFRRHAQECIGTSGGKDPGRTYRRCKCPIHAEGHLGGIMYRRALQVTAWTRAQEMVREKEARGSWDDPNDQKQVTVLQAVETFLGSLAAESNGKAKSTIRKIRGPLVGVSPEWRLKTVRRADEGLLEFCRNKGLTLLHQLTVAVITDWATSWSCGPHHRSKRLQLARRFFRFCIDAEWIDKNPAKASEHARGQALQVKPTLPFSNDEMRKIHDHCADKPKLLALMMLMRH